MLQLAFPLPPAPVCPQLVAIKYLAVYETGARHQLAQELRSLYANISRLPGSTPGGGGVGAAAATMPRGGGASLASAPVIGA